MSGIAPGKFDGKKDAFGFQSRLDELPEGFFGNVEYVNVEEDGLVTVEDSSPDCGGVRRYCELEVLKLKAQQSVLCCHKSTTKALSAFQMHLVARAKQCVEFGYEEAHNTTQEEAVSPRPYKRAWNMHPRTFHNAQLLSTQLLRTEPKCT